jgi:acid phosphatase
VRKYDVDKVTTKKSNFQFLTIVAAVIFAAFFVLSSSAQTVTTNDKEIPNGAIAADEVRFAALGDAGTGNSEQRAVAEQMLAVQRRSQFDLTLFLGDNIYESGSPREIEKKFLKPYRRLLQNGVEVRGSIGNHDARSETGVLLQQLIFGMGAKTYYSFVKNDRLIEFFALDSTLLINEASDPAREAQLRWFENRLAESKAVWKIVFLHHPLYSSAKRHGNASSDEKDVLRLRQSIEPLLVKYAVDIVLNGHDHVYERPKMQAGIQYFTSGSGGKLRRGNLIKTSPFFRFGNDEENSFMLFSVTPRAAQFWSISSKGTILDGGELTKKSN